ncbi:energy transducer TonB [Hymenobacter rubripertinctus]|uniref:Energy transducer TonB n=1 Tax=Hymenobacter rubripertinctus TaxID=2029981 RepID=A0A418R5V8_9BACT|nr:energy transducer TonB [Hymenobacter rubripertinctus]RIY12772.1 energy transducer TonB [Hymenobacter rubripertinctus]
MATAAHISAPSLDDMVFEGRNKAYGAYVLRQVYGRHVTKAVALGITLSALLIALPVIVQQVWPAAAVVVPAVVDDTLTLTHFTEVEPQPKQPSMSSATATIRTHTAETPTKVVRDEDVKKPDQPEIEAPVANGPLVLGDINQDGNNGNSMVPAAGGGNDTAANPAAPAVIKPFVHVEQMPEFVGGNGALMSYLQRQMKYPPQALRAGVEGKVFISFTVNTDGTIDDVEVLKGLGYGTDEEASRVISKMPAWKPGYQNHHAVPVRYTLPITFKYE